MLAPEAGVRSRTKLIFIALHYHSSKELLLIAILSNCLTLPLLAAFLLVLGGKLILRDIPPKLIVLAAEKHVPRLLPVLLYALHSSVLLLEAREGQLRGIALSLLVYLQLYLGLSQNHCSLVLLLNISELHEIGCVFLDFGLCISPKLGNFIFTFHNAGIKVVCSDVKRVYLVLFPFSHEILSQ